MNDDHKAVYDALATGEACALATVISTQGSMPRQAGSKMVVRPDGETVGTVGGGAMESLVIQEALAALADGQTRLKTYTLNDIADGDPGICGGTAQIFIEPINAPPLLLVIGGGHVGRELAQLGKWMGYQVALSDDRERYCNPEYLPNMDNYIVCPPGEVANHVKITPQTYIAAVTRGLPVDVDLIPVLLRSDAAYIGLIGSRRRWALTAQALREKHGLMDLTRVRSPIGLELEAETPKEIALSIMAEIVMIRRGGTGQPMQLRG